MHQNLQVYFVPPSENSFNETMLRRLSFGETQILVHNWPFVGFNSNIKVEFRSSYKKMLQSFYVTSHY
jgi:hypothetical protein